MANRITRHTEIADDRRNTHRMPIERDVRYSVLAEKRAQTPITGMGRTLNMSSGGALFTTESALPDGVRVELAVSWPAQLNEVLPLKLVTMGRLVRTGDDQAAIAIEKYEFRTRGSNAL
jgi:hypothetical protein